jgi:hypothetical protein
MDRAVPNGTAKIAAMMVADSETRKDSPTMPHNVGSPDMIRFIVVVNISNFGLSELGDLPLG